MSCPNEPPDKKIQFWITNKPVKGNIDLDENKWYDLSQQITYEPTAPGYYSFQFEVRYQGQIGINKGTVGIVVNPLTSFSLGPQQESLLEYSKDLIPNSITRLREFVNFIVPTICATIFFWIRKNRTT